ncbi:MAG: SPOR domain-containing protein [Symploca sp. SIO2G7]|nr:SPOR domain-containing protein [Symploca sp. SIO2G7]
MSKNNSVESSTQSSSNQSLNPCLQAALGSLDVQLEEELARYRRKRAGRPVKSARGLGSNQVRQPIELISIKKPVAQTQQPILQESSAPVISLPQTPELRMPPTVLPQEMSPELISDTEQLDDSSVVAPELPESPIDESLVAPSGENEQLTSSEETTEEAANLLPSEPSQEQPEDYLESSEKLLESLREEEANTQPQKRFTSQLLTPLGVGLMLLVLLSGATMIYLAMNPSQFKVLVLDRFFGSPETTTAQNSIGTTSTKGELEQNSSIINGPDLASEEFIDLNLNNLSRLESTPTQTPTPNQTEVPPLPDLSQSNTTSGVSNQEFSGGTDLPSALLPPPPLPETAPPPATPRATVNIPNTVPAQSSPSPTTTAPVIKPEESPSLKSVEAAPPPAQKDRFYYVVSNYTGTQALEQAKTIVPDAYVRKFSEGTQIQLGAFDTETQAKNLVERLQQQGISASVYHTQE